MDYKQHIIILGGGQVAAYAAKEIRLEEKNISNEDKVVNINLIKDRNQNKLYRMKNIIKVKYIKRI